jgi:hypothetical protein
MYLSRNGPDSIRLSKVSADGFCALTLLDEIQGDSVDTVKVRFTLDTRAVVFRSPSNNNLHSRFGNEKGSDTYFEIIY